MFLMKCNIVRIVIVSILSAAATESEIIFVGSLRIGASPRSSDDLST